MKPLKQIQVSQWDTELNQAIYMMIVLFDNVGLFSP